MSTHTYTVTGMTCNGCVNTVRSALAKVPGVTAAAVDLATRQAALEAERSLDVAALNDALKGTKFSLQLPLPPREGLGEGEAQNDVVAVSPARHTLKAFLPLIVIAALILAYTAAMLAWRGSWDTMYAMRHFEAGFFLVFGSFKMLNWKGFADAYATYDLLAARSRLYAFAYPLIEIALGVAYLAEWQLLAVSWVTLALMLIGSVGIARALADQRPIPCACLGTVFKLPMTKVTLAEDLLMAAMAVAMIVMLTGEV